MTKRRVLRGLKFAAIGILFLALFGFVVMSLWNWLVPALFGGRAISFWQALGLLILSKILFGGFRGGPHRGWGYRRRMLERWNQMTPEEREKFRQGLRHGCGPFGRTAPEAKA